MNQGINETMHRRSKQEGAGGRGEALIRRPPEGGAGREGNFQKQILQNPARGSPDEPRPCRRQLPKVSQKVTKIQTLKKVPFLMPKWSPKGPQRSPKIA